MSSEHRRNEDEALRSAFRRLPVAVVVLDDALLLRPFNAKAEEIFEQEGLSSGLLQLRPSHPLSRLFRRILDSEPSTRLGTEVLEFPSGTRYTIDPSRRSEKGGSRWIVLLMQPAVSRDLSQWNFTERETEIVSLLLAGESTKSIVERLSIAENTVKSHIKNVFEKTGARTRTELLAKLLS